MKLQTKAIKLQTKAIKLQTKAIKLQTKIIYKKINSRKLSSGNSMRTIIRTI